jgi:hypothetical protein
MIPIYLVNTGMDSLQGSQESNELRRKFLQSGPLGREQSVTA